MSSSPNISPPPASLAAASQAPKVWIYANFAQHWYEDAQREAASIDDDHSKRREIVFAVNFLESYIFEWTRGISLDHLNTYFPPTGKRQTLKHKWNSVPKKLFEHGFISKKPSLNVTPLGRLVQLRNGLVHARASRPSTVGLSPEEKPVPDIDELKNIPHGWALSIASELVRELHAQLETKPPTYL